MAQPVLHPTLLADSLLALSAFQLGLCPTQSALQTLRRRFLRLWPAYALITLGMAFVFAHLGQGPMWSRTDIARRCAGNWAQNLLLVCALLANEWLPVGSFRCRTCLATPIRSEFAADPTLTNPFIQTVPGCGHSVGAGGPVPAALLAAHAVVGRTASCSVGGAGNWRDHLRPVLPWCHSFLGPSACTAVQSTVGAAPFRVIG